MGQTQSASIPSKEEILRKTKGGTSLVNTLFQWMVSQASIRDFYLMANPAQCRKYIMLTADALNKVFYKIDVLPKEGAKGTIYFQKVDALNPQDKTDPMYKHREINCLRLAFLFVRIFQVFAALSLSILDVEPELEMKLISDITRLQDRSSVPLFGARQQGGSLNAKKSLPSSLEPLRSSLAEIPTNPAYYKFTGTSIYIEYGSVGPDGSVPIKYSYVLTQNGRKVNGSIEGKLNVERRGQDGLSLRLTRLKQSVGSLTKDLDDTNVNFTRQSIEDIFRDRKSNPIPEGMNYAFGKLAAGEKENERDKERDDAYPYGYGKQKEKSASFTQFEKDMGEVSEGLHTKTIVSAFTRATPPKTHCIARALQLLSDSGLQASFPKEIYSHICKTKFLVETRSLPPANERITKEDGIYALAQLFYDTLKESTPAISEKTQNQYKSFVTKMKFVFEEQKDGKGSTGKGPLDEVVNKIPSAVCDSKVIDKTLKTSNREVIRQLRDNVRRMVLYQISHTANVVKILRKLFLLPVESGKSLQIHPRVLKSGMEEVNVLAEEARNLLIDYYSQCEILYRSGAEIIAASKSNMTAL